MKKLLLIVCCFMLLVFSKGVGATSAPQLEYKVKAAFLVNFVRFISWPTDSFTSNNDPLTICIIGDDPFGNAFAGIEGKKIQGRNVKIVKYKSLSQIKDCHLLYISSSQKSSLQNYLQSTAIKPIVTVSELKGSSSMGAIFEFIKVDDRLSFKINNSKAKAAGLHVDASLLDLAAEVY